MTEAEAAREGRVIEDKIKEIVRDQMLEAIYRSRPGLWCPPLKCVHRNEFTLL